MQVALGGRRGLPRNRFFTNRQQKGFTVKFQSLASVVRLSRARFQIWIQFLKSTLTFRRRAKWNVVLIKSICEHHFSFHPAVEWLFSQRGEIAFSAALCAKIQCRDAFLPAKPSSLLRTFHLCWVIDYGVLNRNISVSKIAFSSESMFCFLKHSKVPFTFRVIACVGPMFSLSVQDFFATKHFTVVCKNLWVTLHVAKICD